VKISKALMLLRVRYDFSQADLGKKTGMSSISDIELGKRPPRLDELEAYAKVFGISTSAIMRFAEDLDDPTYLFPPLLVEKRIKSLEGRRAQVPRVRKLKDKPES